MFFLIAASTMQYSLRNLAMAAIAVSVVMTLCKWSIPAGIALGCLLLVLLLRRVRTTNRLLRGTTQVVIQLLAIGACMSISVFAEELGGDMVVVWPLLLGSGVYLGGYDGHGYLPLAVVAVSLCTILPMAICAEAGNPILSSYFWFALGEVNVILLIPFALGFLGVKVVKDSFVY